MALLLTVITTLSFICIASAVDPSPLQDLCVADYTRKVRMNGLPCKDPTTIILEDFLFKGLHLPGKLKPVAFKPIDVTALPGLNTQGLSLLRFDLTFNSSISPHSHPRATEIIWVYSGAVEAGFVSNGIQYNINLTRGDVYVFPSALVHYFRNVATGNSVVMAVFNSQLPGYAAVPPSIYGA